MALDADPYNADFVLCGIGQQVDAESLIHLLELRRSADAGLHPSSEVTMTTTIPSSDIVVPVETLFTDAERIALTGFLAGYSGLTRDAYALDLRMFTSWCQQHRLRLFQGRRVDIECFGRELESRGRARATIARRLCTVAGFYRYAVEEELLDQLTSGARSATEARYESHAIALDRNELGALLVAAGLGAPSEPALMSLLAINGLRISKALGADPDKFGLERGHRTLTVLRKGDKIVTIPLAPRTARAPARRVQPTGASPNP